jgi:hypothetical protein
MIQNVVLGSIKFESVSLFTIILSDVKLWINFSQNYIFLTSGTIISYTIRDGSLKISPSVDSMMIVNRIKVWEH